MKNKRMEPDDLKNWTYLIIIASNLIVNYGWSLRPTHTEVCECLHIIEEHSNNDDRSIDSDEVLKMIEIYLDSLKE